MCVIHGVTVDPYGVTTLVPSPDINFLFWGWGESAVVKNRESNINIKVIFSKKKKLIFSRQIHRRQGKF